MANYRVCGPASYGGQSRPDVAGNAWGAPECRAGGTNISDLLGKLRTGDAARGDKAGTRAMTITRADRFGALYAAAATLAMLLGTGGLLASAAQAQIPTEAASPAETPRKTAAPNKAEQSLNRGIEAYKKNSLARAVGAFSSALSSGGLDTAGTARALYYRGLAYRKQGQTALAITDLTNALWLKNGLSETERADALSNRAAAYKTAGIADPGAPQTEARPAATAAAAVPAPSAASEAPPPAATAVAATPATETPAASDSANPLSGIGNFFGNLFSGTASSSPDPATQQASPAALPSDDLTTASTGNSVATSSWSSATQVGGAAEVASSATKSKRQRTAALRQAPVKTDAAPVAQAAPPLKGKYKLQLAAVRSRAEAEQLAQRFAAEYGGKIGGRTPVIEEAVFGNMGTFYRVNIGPYASASEPDKLCGTVRGSGFDCLVVSR